MLDQEWPQNMHRCLMASISKLNGGILCTCRTPMLKENQLLDWHTPLAGRYVWNNNSGPVYKKSMFVDRKRCSSVSKSRPPWPHSRLCGSITPSLYGSINILKGQLQGNHGNTGHHGNATKFYTGIEKMNSTYCGDILTLPQGTTRLKCVVLFDGLALILTHACPLQNELQQLCDPMTFHLESTSIFKLWRWTTVIIECDLLFCRKPGWCLLFCGCFFQIVNYNIKYKIFLKYLKCLYLYMVVFQVETKSPFLLNLHADVVVERSVMYIIYCRTLTGSLGRQFRLYKSCFFTKRQLFYLLRWGLDVCVFDRSVQKTKTHQRWNLQVRRVISAASQEHGHITASGWALFLFSSVRCFYEDHLPSGIKRLRSTGIDLEVYVSKAAGRRLHYFTLTSHHTHYTS